MGNNKLSYSEYYWNKYKRDFAKKPEKTPETEKPEEKKEIEKKVENAQEKIERAYEEFEEAKQPKYIQVLKIIIILIVLGVLGYLLYSNFIASYEFTYFYDIGSEQDIKKSYLSPLTRISDVTSEEDANYSLCVSKN